MLRKRIIPCLDIKDGRTVKGTNFRDLVDAGDPIALAKKYSELGADELVLLDISATQEKRKTVLDLVKAVSRQVSIPFSVGGGVSSVSLAYDILQYGADKVCINSAAIRQPSLVSDMAKLYGSQCIVVAVDAKYVNDKWLVHTHGGTRPTELTLLDWVQQAADLGCGEILFTSMDHDGTKAGYAIEPLREVSQKVTVPVIASGGAGTADHFVEVFSQTAVTGALAASIFHFQQVAISETKAALQRANIPVRL